MATGRVPTTANSPLTAKGDLFGYSTTQARVAVGNDGETLVADSSATTGLRYTENYAAGKNKIINGDFSINQRAFSSTTTTSTFTFDRWMTTLSGGTSTFSAQTFTPGAAPVSGYESTNFIRIATTGQSAASDNTRYRYKVEDVRIFAGQTVTLSFWAKAGSGTPSIAAYFVQVFGSGGSTAVTINGQKKAITTSWARYTITLAIPSISGKTLGAGSYLELLLTTSAGTDYDTRTDSLGVQTATIDIWGVQLEAGSVATAFQTATGTIQGELAACQRYFVRLNCNTSSFIGHGMARNASIYGLFGAVPLPTFMRTAPSLSQSGLTMEINGGSAFSLTAIITQSSPNNAALIAERSGNFSADAGLILRGNSSNNYLDASSEL